MMSIAFNVSAADETVKKIVSIKQKSDTEEISKDGTKTLTYTVTLSCPDDKPFECSASTCASNEASCSLSSIPEVTIEGPASGKVGEGTSALLTAKVKLPESLSKETINYAWAIAPPIGKFETSSNVLKWPDNVESNRTYIIKVTVSTSSSLTTAVTASYHLTVIGKPIEGTIEVTPAEIKPFGEVTASTKGWISNSGGILLYAWFMECEEGDRRQLSPKSEQTTIKFKAPVNSGTQTQECSVIVEATDELVATTAKSSTILTVKAAPAKKSAVPSSITAVMSGKTEEFELVNASTYSIFGPDPGVIEMTSSGNILTFTNVSAHAPATVNFFIQGENTAGESHVISVSLQIVSSTHL